MQPYMGVCLEFGRGFRAGRYPGEGRAWVGGTEPHLCPAPAHRRIVDRMDRAGDGDGWVSLAELRSWIAHTQQRHIRDSVSAAWDTYDTDSDGRVGWEELRNATYGHYAPGTRRGPAPYTHTMTLDFMTPSP